MNPDMPKPDEVKQASEVKDKEEKGEIIDSSSLEFIYDTENELKRLHRIGKEKDFYIKYGYKVGVPEGLRPDEIENFDPAELEQMVTAELDHERADEITKRISEALDENAEKINRLFDDFDAFMEKPKGFKIILSQYGTGGSYQPPNTIILNMKGLKDPFEVFLHEAIHCFIEDEIIQKQNLTHSEKESLLNWFMTQTPEIDEILPNTKIQEKFGYPSGELLRRTGLTDWRAERIIRRLPEYGIELDNTGEIKDSEGNNVPIDQYTNDSNAEIGEYFDQVPIEGVKSLVFKSQDDIKRVYKLFWPKKEAPSYLKAFSPSRYILTISQDALHPDDKEQGHKHLQELIRHEITHKYVGNINFNTPSWLAEGTCYLLAGQNNGDPGEITIERLKKLSNSQDKEKYPVGWKMVSSIIEGFGKEKLLELIAIKDEDLFYKELQKMFDWLE